MTYFSQMAGLAVQNFVSAAVGICVAIALIRGIAARRGGRSARQLLAGPRPHDCSTCCCRSRSSARSLLVSQGVDPEPRRLRDVHTLAGGTQTIALGPVASQEVIKELGTNGGGFFNVNSAMPFENPTGLSNFVELLADPADPGLADLRPTGAWSATAARAGRSSPRCRSCSSSASRSCYVAEQHGTPAQHLAGVSTHALRRLDRRQPGGQGAALRHRQLGAVDGGHHGHLVRRGQRRVRVADRPRRRGAVRQPLDERGRLRRRRHRACTRCCCSSCSPCSSAG